MAFDVIDDCFDEGGEEARNTARKAQHEVDLFLIKMMIDEVCGTPKSTQGGGR